MAGKIVTATRNKILDHLLGKTAYTMPTNVYIGLSSTTVADDGSNFTEPTIGVAGYARKQCTGADWEAASAGATQNANALAFTESSGAWASSAPLTDFGIFEAATGGTCTAKGVLTNARTVDAAGITLQFAAGALDATLT